MQRTVLAGIVLIIVGTVGLTVFGGRSAAAPWQGAGIESQRGLWGWMPGWGSMPRHMRGGMGNHMGWWGQSAPSGAAPPPLAGAPTIEVTGLDFRFQPAEIRIKAGQNVNIALANRGAIIHDITIPALQVSLVAQPGQRVTAGLAAARPGTYEFYCSVPGHREAGMVGRLVVVP
jgi:plastocyanin